MLPSSLFHTKRWNTKFTKKKNESHETHLRHSRTFEAFVFQSPLICYPIIPFSHSLIPILAL